MWRGCLWFGFLRSKFGQLVCSPMVLLLLVCAFFVRGDGSCLEIKCLMIALRSRSLIWICYDDGCL